MKVLRLTAYAIGLLTLCLVVQQLSAADEDSPRKGKGKGKGGGDRFGAEASLLPSGAADKLKLTNEQKDKVAKLDKEYQEKRKETFAKAREAMEKARKDEDREAMRKAFTQMREAFEAGRKVRDEYLAKVEGLLTADQKKDFEDIKKERSGRFGRPGGDRPGRPGGDRPGRPGGEPGTGLSPRIQEELKLTQEQKDKIAKLQKDLDAKIQDVLTDEQKKKLEELKKARPGSRRERQ
jgi:Spy/CpxP family protein refolding chaperone